MMHGTSSMPVYDDSDEIVAVNPIQYRGYYYDKETGLYYLQSRYYDSETGRFINADNQIFIGHDLTGMNPFAYCGNNTIIFDDPTGMWRQVSVGWQAQSGDTLWGLADMLYGNGSKWTSFGFNRDPKTLRVGEVINTIKNNDSGNRALRDVTFEVNAALRPYASMAQGM